MKRNEWFFMVLVTIMFLAGWVTPAASQEPTLIGDTVQAALIRLMTSPTDCLVQFTSEPVLVCDPGVEFTGELRTTAIWGPGSNIFLDYSVAVDIFSDYFTVTIAATNNWQGYSMYGISAPYSIYNIQLSDLDLPGGIGPVTFDPSRSAGFFLPDDIREITWDTSLKQVNLRFARVRDSVTYAFVLQADPTASAPSPSDGSAGVSLDVQLSWTPGDAVDWQDVYIGTDEAAVAAADISDITGIYRGRHSPTATTFWLEDLVADTTYYWRIDGIVGAVIHKGDVWSFTTLATNHTPVANAGLNQTVAAGDTVSLDGNGSSDPDGDALSYNWTIVSAPEGSLAEIINPTSVGPHFAADLAGVYNVSLVVNDGVIDSAPAAVTITVVPAEDAAVETLAQAADMVDELLPNNLRSQKKTNDYKNKIDTAFLLIEMGEYADALEKLQDDIIKRTDGCAKTGAPDSNDWLLTCGAQAMLYPSIARAIELVERLL